MPDRWVERPRVYPHKCVVSGKGDIESGPYYEFGVEYYQYPADDATPSRLYISAKYLRAPFDKDGAPIRIVSEQDYELLTQERDDLRLERDELAVELEQMSIELEHERDIFAKARTKKTGIRRAPKATEQ